MVVAGRREVVSAGVAEGRTTDAEKGSVASLQRSRFRFVQIHDPDRKPLPVSLWVNFMRLGGSSPKKRSTNATQCTTNEIKKEEGPLRTG